MALKSTTGSGEPLDIEEHLELLEQQIERLKVMYEQYFMGIQKMAPGQLHRDVERGIREMTQMQIRNTALRYRFTTVSQKFGSYNSYWRRTMNEIESGRYIRHVSRVARQAQRDGLDVPEELLVKMPKRMRERILRDREALASRAAREGKIPAAQELAAVEPAAAEAAAPAPPAPEQVRVPPPRVHQLDEGAGDLDMDSMFASIMDQDPPTAPKVVVPTGPVVPAKAAPPAPVPKVVPPGPPPKVVPPRPPTPRPPPTPATSRPAATSPPATPPPATPPPRPAGPPPGMTEQQGRDLYARYVQARKLAGEKTDDITYEKLMATLNRQAPKIMQEHKASGVEFNVALKDNKVILKAKPKK